MLVLFCAVFLLGVIPATLLWLGRMIEANTDGRGRIKAQQAKIAELQGDGDPNRAPWFSQPMKPVFGEPRRAAPTSVMPGNTPENMIGEGTAGRGRTEPQQPEAVEFRDDGDASGRSWFRQPMRPAFNKPHQAA